MRYNAVDTNLCDFTSQIRDVMAHKTPTYKYNFANSSLSRKINKDTLEKSNKSADGIDDGKISFKEKLKNFGKGLIAPIKTMFSSPKNIAMTALSAAGCAGLIALTGGAAAPVLVALGVTGGVFQIGKGIYKQATAKTDEQAQNAWQDIGSGTFTTGVSALAAKSALKANQVDTKGMSTLKAVSKCFKDFKTNTVKSFTNVKSNIANLGNTLKFWKKNNTEAASETQGAEGKFSGRIKDSFKKLKDKVLKKDKSSNKSENASKADAPEAPRADTPETPRAKTPEASKADAPETPRAKAPEAPRADAPDAPKADVPETPRAKAPDAPKADAPDAPKADAPDAPKADVPETPRADAPEAPNANATPATELKADAAPTNETGTNNTQKNGKLKFFKNGIKEIGNRFKELLEVFGIGIDKV